jgi:hypothetical protein
MLREPDMSRQTKFLKRKRREEKRLAARTAQIEQQPPDRLMCSFCHQRPPKFLVLVNPKAQCCTYLAWGEDLDEKLRQVGRLMCSEHHCFFECFDAWRTFQQEWIAEEQRQEMMQQIEDVIYRGKVPAHLLEEDEVIAELKET